MDPSIFASKGKKVNIPSPRLALTNSGNTYDLGERRYGSWGEFSFLLDGSRKINLMMNLGIGLTGDKVHQPAEHRGLRDVRCTHNGPVEIRLEVCNNLPAE